MRFLSAIVLIPVLAYGQLDPPPNGVKISDSVYLDATEVANIHWLEFEFYVRKDSSFKYWQSIQPYQEVTEGYRKGYFRDPSYRYFPVVGITYWQALQYCEWRMNVVNEKLEQGNKSWRIRYRLPTEKEWEVAAKKVDSLALVRAFVPKIKSSSRKEIKRYFSSDTLDFKTLRREVENFQKDSLYDFAVDQNYPWFVLNEERLPEQIYSRKGIGNQGLIHHLIGNVAEMVMEEGVVKGGSWRHSLPNSFPSKKSRIESNKAYDWVGFRCLAEVIPVRD